MYILVSLFCDFSRLRQRIINLQFRNKYADNIPYHSRAFSTSKRFYFSSETVQKKKTTAAKPKIRRAARGDHQKKRGKEFFFIFVSSDRKLYKDGFARGAGDFF